MSKEDLKALGKSALRKMHRKSFTVSRKVTGRGGDTFLSVAIEMDEDTTAAEARVAYMLAFLECNETVFRSARASSLINDDELENALKVLRHNFSRMIGEAARED